jgi:hypothetical protein
MSKKKKKSESWIVEGVFRQLQMNHANLSFHGLLSFVEETVS